MARELLGERPRVLLVEGDDEEHFFHALLRHMGVTGLEVISVEGNPNFRAEIAAVTKMSGFHKAVAFGVVRDAEGNAGGAFQSVADAMEAAGLPRPETVGELVDGHPTVGAYIVPGDGEQGAIETLLLRSVDHLSEVACVDAMFDCLQGQGHEASRQPHKARALVFLATRKYPVPKVGIAAEKGYWPLDHDAFAGLREFLLSLVEA